MVRAEIGRRPRRRWRLGQRRIGLPLLLFLLTCGSTFFAGVTGWMPMLYVFRDETLLAPISNDPYLLIGARRAVLVHWQDGLIYMGCILAILLTHEMGHFVMTIVYRVRSTLPFFIPLPISPIGTLGAVICMDGLRANRRQIFDIGLAGPLAGLAVAIPIIWIGATRLDLRGAAPGDALELPLVLRLLVERLHPGAYQPATGVPFSALNPYFMAGWVGLLITALNMMPVSQLDGGHVLYALFGRAAHWIARLFMFFVFIYLSVTTIYFDTFPFWIVMALLVLLLGTDHPSTRDDRMPLGWFRTLLGLASLLIPVLCFTPNPFRM
jgi:membrane-associated protease RseP (regulator of RpoE activity)